MLSSTDSRLALSVFVEAYANGRRAAVLGGEGLALALTLAAAGARSVHVYDPAIGHAYAPHPAVTAQGWPAGEFPVRRGAFDVVLVPDAAAVPDLVALLAELRRLVADEGFAVVGFRSEGPWGYEDLYDRLQLQFANVRMFGQVPFRGVVVAELGVDEVDVTVDHSAAPPGDPAVYLAVVSATPVPLEGYAIVAVPKPATREAGSAEAVLESSAAVSSAAVSSGRGAAVVDVGVTRDAAVQAEAEIGADERPTGEQPAVRADMAELQARFVAQLRELELRAQQDKDARHVELTELQLRVKYLEAEVEREHRAATELLPLKEDARRARLLEMELGKATDATRIAERDCAQAVAHADKLAAEARRLAAEVDRLSAVARAGADARDAGAAAAALEIAAQTHEAALALAVQQAEEDAEIRVEETLAGVAALEQEWANREAEVYAEGEARLRERGQRVRDLEAQVGRAERIVRELVLRTASVGGASGGDAGTCRQLELERAQLLGDNATLSQRLDALAREVAQRDAELDVRGWQADLAAPAAH